ncbi:hypothetical protein LIER_23476 [Lithospermum erythrorhizon]|uniref:Uncharacterized protein n=1 Tax=Lithospermum erythrorhizon TaxID=34254 RepID=A0AAV3QZ38_LITER
MQVGPTRRISTTHYHNWSENVTRLGFGRVYTVVVINCTFPTSVEGGGDGELYLSASTNDGGDAYSNATDTFVTLTEAQKDFVDFESKFTNTTPNLFLIFLG